MAHIPDGILSVPVLVAGAVLTAGGLAMGVRRLDASATPKVALLSATLFVASLVHLPAGVASVHLLLNGLAGMVLGWAVFPAMLVALLLQVVLFGFGGLAALGVNTAIMAGPGLLAGWLFRAVWRNGGRERAALAGILAGAGAVMATAALVGLALALSGRQFLAAAQLAVATHLPVAVIEAAVTAATASLLATVRPRTLEPWA